MAWPLANIFRPTFCPLPCVLEQGRFEFLSRRPQSFFSGLRLRRQARRPPRSWRRGRDQVVGMSDGAERAVASGAGGYPSRTVSCAWSVSCQVLLKQHHSGCQCCAPSGALERTRRGCPMRPSWVGKELQFLFHLPMIQSTPRCKRHRNPPRCLV